MRKSIEAEQTLRASLETLFFQGFLIFLKKLFHFFWKLEIPRKNRFAKLTLIQTINQLASRWLA
jgi:hypothetical protein